MVEDLAVTKADREFLADATKAGGSVIINPLAEVIAGPMRAASRACYAPTRTWT